MIDLSICIPTYNRNFHLINCLNSLKLESLNSNLNLEVCVSDNYSTESGLDILFIEARALSTSAQIYLNILYKYGFGEKIKPYNIKILNFWRELAKENMGRPNVFLGIYYAEGLGVEKNYKIAQMYSSYLDP